MGFPSHHHLAALSMSKLRHNAGIWISRAEKKTERFFARGLSLQPYIW
jgi:hypothetical protein